MESYIDRLTLIENEKIKISTFTYEKLHEVLDQTSEDKIFVALDQNNAADCSTLDIPELKMTNDLGVTLTNPLRIRIFTREDLNLPTEADMRVLATIFIAKEGTVIQTSSSFDQDGKEYKNYHDLSIAEQNGLFEDVQRYFGVT